MAKENSTIQCTSCKHDNLIKLANAHRLNHPLTLFGYFFIVASIGGVILSWVFLSKILGISVASGSSLIVHTFLFTLLLTVFVGILMLYSSVSIKKTRIWKKKPTPLILMTKKWLQ